MATIRKPTEADYDRVFDLTRQAFNAPSTARERGRSDFNPEDGRVVEENGRIVATLRTLPFAQWWGGRSVKSAGVAGVAVPPEQRGKGYGTMLMEQTLRDLRAQDTLISTLYPATSPIYRAAGYGYGGIRSQWELSLDHLNGRPGATVEEYDASMSDELRACYDGFARREYGVIDRPADWWDRRVMSSAWDADDPYVYVVREEGRITGYMIYRLGKNKEEWRSVLGCRDLIWTTPAAAQALLATAALHRSTSSKLAWAGPASEPLADLLPEDKIDLDFRFRWMVRLLDLPGAIEARGYPRGFDATVTIGSRDPLFPENDGPWRIEVVDGRAKVTPADREDATADIQTWATIWSGLHRASDERRLGALDAPEEAVDALDLIFAGPTPWLADFF